jgi:hypothetical protein
LGPPRPEDWGKLPRCPLAMVLPDNLWIGDWVGPRAGPNAVKERKSLFLSEIEHPSPQAFTL